MYVLCAGMYRACSTWQYEVITHLLDKHRGGERLGYLTGEEFATRYQAGDHPTAWCVLKSHEGDGSFARAIAEGEAVTVYAYRDVRDVVFSLMHKRGVTFEQLVGQGMIHQILVNDRFWSRQPGVLVQSYENLVADPVTGVLELAAHLGLSISRDEAVEVAGEYSFQTNRRRTLELVERLRSQGVDLNDPSNLQYYDQKTLLHWNHLREGRPGNWRTHATPGQRAVLSRLCDDWLVAHGYEADTLDPSAPAESASTRLRREWELARAWLTCALRCAALRHPQAARSVKRVLGISTGAAPAVAARSQPQSQPHVRIDAPQEEASTPSEPTGSKLGQSIKSAHLPRTEAVAHDA